MIEIFNGDDTGRLKMMHELRRRAFGLSRRDPIFRDAWVSDGHDKNCHHLLMRDPEGAPVAGVRIALGDRWPLEDWYDGALDKARGVEFGRLAVAHRYCGDRRTMHELIVEACRYCGELGRSQIYGLMIASFYTSLKKVGIPLEVLSGPIRAYGEDENVVVFRVGELLALYETWHGAEREPTPRESRNRSYG